ncbi:hypothetical protein P280DRAFT_408934 [Massarina eburnea CBS 473.64]|uniref:Metallo-beta-lactamase domain-containing protein n=1 Tax=Massarina eburnea CBS 473.64 TaxID=1395130 RepID=A0A6A6RQ86_9PLEO|nr:hypothetical protein P280DRAFT_408934 [Massarina eburnea CBS 473.64]
MKYESGDQAICFTCGTQYDAPLSSPPSSCRICDDPRQYVPPTGQTWTSLNECAQTQHNECTTDAHDPRIHYISTLPKVAAELPPGLADTTTTRKQLGIGQRSILIQTAAGNVLWDLVAFLDDATVEFVRERGGVKAIVISHPHFWTTHLEWARVFGCPVYLCSLDSQWLNTTDTHSARHFLTTTTPIPRLPSVTVIVAGGHFDGSMVLHWENKLFIADTIMSVPSAHTRTPRLPNTTSYAFMYAYPNMIPLPPHKIHGIWTAIAPFGFTRTYGGFAGQNIVETDLRPEILSSMKIFLRTAGHEKAAVYDEFVS